MLSNREQVYKVDHIATGKVKRCLLILSKLCIGEGVAMVQYMYA